MEIVVVGLSHKTAPVAIREKVAFAPEVVGSVPRLFEALAMVRAAGVPAGLVCSGGVGDSHARLQAQVRRLGLGEAVRFAGYVSPLEGPTLCFESHRSNHPKELIVCSG